MDDNVEIEIDAGESRLTLTPEQFKVIDAGGAETIGQLYDRLPPDEWTDLPEYGVRVRKWTEGELR